jgi:transcriptional regulator with XRE-family HTH domain
MFLNLKLSILQAGIRQNRLAQVVNIDEAVLSRIINGFREPTYTQRKLIAEFLQKDEKWLFEKYVIRGVSQGPANGSPAKPQFVKKELSPEVEEG